MNQNYEDIIHLPNYRSTKHPHLSMEMRAAQFAPFAALTGHEDAVKEKARHTDEQLELDESALEEIDQMLHHLREMIATHPEVTVTYYQPDEKKSGGTYLTLTDEVTMVDDRNQLLRFRSGQEIQWSHLYKIEPVKELFEDE